MGSALFEPFGRESSGGVMFDTLSDSCPAVGAYLHGVFVPDEVREVCTCESSGVECRAGAGETGSDHGFHNEAELDR